jgi:hypothetical protein
MDEVDATSSLGGGVSDGEHGRVQGAEGGMTHSATGATSLVKTLVFHLTNIE